MLWLLVWAFLPALASSTPPPPLFDVESVQECVRARASRRVLNVDHGLGRWAHALPHTLRAEFRQTDESDWSGTLYDDEGWTRRATGGDTFGWRIVVEWDLSRLAHNPAWAAEQHRRRVALERVDDAVDNATRLVFERRRLLRRAGRLQAGDPARQDALLRSAELAARLNFLCGAPVRAPPGGG